MQLDTTLLDIVYRVGDNKPMFLLSLFVRCGLEGERGAYTRFCFNHWAGLGWWVIQNNGVCHHWLSGGVLEGWVKGCLPISQSKDLFFSSH